MAQYEINTEPLPIDFAGSADDGVARILQNCKNLLMLRRGEIPYDRNRGLDPALFDLPPDEFEMVLLPELDRVMRYEPAADVVSASYEFSDDRRIIINCVVEINTDEE